MYRLIFLALITTISVQAEEPILRIETGMHTAVIRQISVDAAERFLVTASDDKTLRLWDLHTGDLLKTYRVPIGADNEGKLYSAAISPDGEWVMGAGWTKGSTDSHNIYIFNRASGELIKRLSGLDDVILHLCGDGQYLGATLEGANGVRVWDTQTWQLILSDTDYANGSHWCDFDSQNRLVTSSYDGYLRLYSSNGLLAKSKAPGGLQPFAAVFSPAGDQIAVGFNDSTNVNVLDGQNLAFLYASDTGIDNDNYNLSRVAWSQDGNSLYAAGMYWNGTSVPVVHWSQGNKAEWQGAKNTITDIRSLKNGRIVYAAADPAFAVLDQAGNKIVERKATIADYRNNREGFLISHDGNRVQFAFEQWGKRPARFSLTEQSLILNPDDNLAKPDTTSLNITDWKNNFHPKLNGNVLPLEQNERSRSLAIAPDQSKFILGTDWHLYLFDTQAIWKVDAPSVAWAVNISGDGKKAVAAFADGSIRWYNLANGEELLAFFPHKEGWVAWTKSGYYMSSGDEADNLIGWHINNGKDKPASFYPAGALHSVYKHPEVVTKILMTMDEDEALRLANIERVNVGDALEAVKYKINLKPSGLGKAIIVAASGADSNTLFPYTHEFTTEMYRFLYNKGFSDGDVIFMSPRLPIVPANNYPDAARQDFKMTSKKELQQAIAQASQDLQAGQQFVFYLHGHARPDAVRLSKTEELSAQELKALLAQIPTNVKQIIILDTCYSGSFMDELAGVANRIVISSADAKALVWSTETMSFSEIFIRQLRNGNSVGEAFDLAESMIINEPEIFGAQRPQLDDTQDGLYDNNDGQLARQTFIGGKKVHSSLPPSIIEIHPTIQRSQTTATLWVKTIPGFNGIKKVRAILVNEHDKVTEYQGENTDFTRRELTLKRNHNLQRYEIDYDQFHTASQWKIFYQAQSMEGEWSEISTGYAGSDSVAIEAKLNKTTYQVGEKLQFDVTVSGEKTADLYVGVILPNGFYLTIVYPLAFSEINVLQAYKTDIQLTGGESYEILSFSLPAIPTGDYQVCGLLTEAQSDPYNVDNWLKLNCRRFYFQ